VIEAECIAFLQQTRGVKSKGDSTSPGNSPQTFSRKSRQSGDGFPGRSEINLEEVMVLRAAGISFRSRAMFAVLNIGVEELTLVLSPAFVLFLVVWPFWRIFAKAGFPGWLAVGMPLQG
jgi:hypothetical protein